MNILPNPTSPEVQLAKYASWGFSEYSATKFLPSLKITNLKEFNEIAKRVQDIVEPLKKEIALNNAQKPLYIRIIDVILSTLSFGYIRLCEREIDVNKVNACIKKISDFIKKTPLHKQTWRMNHAFLPDAVALVQTNWKKRLEKILKREKKTLEHWRLYLLKKKWIHDHPLENKRILGSGLLTKSNLRVIDRLAANSLASYFSGANSNKKQQIISVIGQALELKKMYGKDYYVFTHGQSLSLSVINECMHELVRMFDPKNYHLFVLPLRIPGSVPHVDNVDQFAQKYKIDSFGFVDDHHNNEIISCDTYFWSTTTTESALYCFSKQWNMTSNANYVKIFNHYVKDGFLAGILSSKAVNIATEKAGLSTVGTLNLICIPKATVEDPKKTYVYPSHAFGVRRKTTHVLDIEILRKTQKDYSLAMLYPQYRILAAPLSKDQNARAFALNSLTPKQNQDYHHRVMLLVNETALYVALQNLSASSNEEQVNHIVKLIEWMGQFNYQPDQIAIKHILKNKQSIPPIIQTIFS